MTPENVRIYFKNTLATAKGNLDQNRKNQARTCIQQDPEPEEWNVMPTSKDGSRSNHVFVATYSTEDIKSEIHTDLTGRFPVTSTNGNEYIFVLYNYDSNAILIEPLKNRSSQSIVNAYELILKRLCKAGLRPKLQRLNNEASALLRDFMKEQNI